MPRECPKTTLGKWAMPPVSPGGSVPPLSWAGGSVWPAVRTMPTFAKNFQAGSRSDLALARTGSLRRALPEPVLLVFDGAGGPWPSPQTPLRPPLWSTWRCQQGILPCREGRGRSTHAVGLRGFPAGRFLACPGFYPVLFWGHGEHDFLQTQTVFRVRNYVQSVDVSCGTCPGRSFCLTFVSTA